MIAPDRPPVYGKGRYSVDLTEYLIYEIIDGEPYYRKGYRDVLNGTKTFEDIRGCGVINWVILGYFLRLLFEMPGKNDYHIATNKPGLHLDGYNNLVGHIVVFNKKDLPGAAISVKYVTIPGLLHIEVDITVDVEEGDVMGYLEKKVNKLLDFGTKKIIWVFTKGRRMLIATKEDGWQWHDWSENLPLIENVSFNVVDYLKVEGINI